MNIENIKLGFSTGVLHKTHRTKEALKKMRDLGYDTVELGFVNPARIEEGWLDELTKEDLEGFKYVSFHTPKHNYGKNEGTYSFFKKVERIDKMRKLDLVVFHPDMFEDFSVLNEVGFNVALENMDNRKGSHKQPEDFDGIFSQDNKYKFVFSFAIKDTSFFKKFNLKDSIKKIRKKIILVQFFEIGAHSPL